MDKATQTMIENLSKNTGKTLEQWIAMVQKESYAKHGEIMNPDSNSRLIDFVVLCVVACMGN